MKTKNQLLGAYHEKIDDVWYPTSWCDDGSFIDPAHPKKLDLMPLESTVMQETRTKGDDGGN